MRFPAKIMLTGMAVCVLMLTIFIVMTVRADRNAIPCAKRGGKVFIRWDGERYTLYRNGKPFTVRGASGSAFLQELHEAGGNTIRTYDTTNLAQVLDEADRYGIAVIAGLPIPYSSYLDDFWKDAGKVNALHHAFRETVERYRGHPALLMWCLGNEPVMPWKPGNEAFYTAYNQLLNMIHTRDPDHPVTTTMPNYNLLQILMIRHHVPELDLISFNTFGQLKQLEQQAERFAWLWNGPFLIMEWGAYGPWESELTAWDAPIENTSTKKAEHFRTMYREQMPLHHPRFLGSLVFYWGAKQEITPTWFSLFSAAGGATEPVEVLHNLWKNERTGAAFPKMKYMLLDGMGARDNIMLSPGSAHTAEYFPDEENRAAIASVQWAVMKEDWYEDPKKRSLPAVLLDTVSAGRRLRFTAPLQEGPYRVYVSITDNAGRTATANTPFYVIDSVCVK